MTWTDRLTPREFAGLVDAGRIGRDGGPYVPVPLRTEPVSIAELQQRFPDRAPPALACSSCRALPVRVHSLEPPRNEATGHKPPALYRCAWCGHQMSKREAERGPA